LSKACISSYSFKKSIYIKQIYNNTSPVHGLHSNTPRGYGNCFMGVGVGVYKLSTPLLTFSGD
jgi:hypothetical protein